MLKRGWTGRITGKKTTFAEEYANNAERNIATIYPTRTDFWLRAVLLLYLYSRQRGTEGV